MAGFFSQLNIPKQCKKYGVPLWQCPQFLFLIMGGIIILTTVFSYLVGSRYISDPEVVALIVLVVASVLLVLSFIIIKSFENLADASRMKSEFINVTSHQLRAPLVNLKWGVELLMSEKYEISKEKKESYFNILKENIGRMSDLINDLLLVARIEQGVFLQRRKETALDELTENILSQFQYFAQSMNIKLSFTHDKNLPMVNIDPSQIKIAIENLIDNALHYSLANSQVTIRLIKKGDHLIFSVKDSGVGIPETEKKFIFQKFFRAENVLKEKTGGSGLGLFITKTIIEKSRGKIWFESEEKKGTTFYFTLPIK